MRSTSARAQVAVALVLFGGVATGIGACGSDSGDTTTTASPDGGASSGTPGSSSGNPDASGISTSFDASAPVVVDGHCGYQNTGTPLHVADGIDVCMPKIVCAPETCPPALGDCVNGQCQFKPGYNGILTLKEAWSTEYCDLLQNGGCHGITQIDFPENNAAAISQALGFPICENDGSGHCIGVAAAPPMIVGNSQETKDPATGQPVKLWGLGTTEATGLCYEVTGPGGTATVALVDRCGGYCKCGSGTDFSECGACVNASDMQTNCTCVGDAPPAYSGCCGNNCGVPVKQDCDWCANNNHPHFDLDNFTFAHVCGPASSAGSCKLSALKPVNCLAPKAWPPGSGGGGGGGVTCGANSFQCSAPADQQPMVPGTGCCCNFGLQPQPDKSCK